MLSESWLQGGNDIPFPPAQIIIHQPRVKDIFAITEENFYKGCNLINISKNKIQLQDKTDLSNISNFEIFMSIVTSKEIAVNEDVQAVKMIMMLLFPNYKITYNEKVLVLVGEDNKPHFITDEFFQGIKEIISEMFSLKENQKEELNPSGDLAREIADKIKAGRAKVAALKGKGANEKIAVLSRYISILSVGLQKDKNELLNYTVWQLTDEFLRFQSKVENDYHYQAIMAGAQNLKDVDPWMRDLYDE